MINNVEFAQRLRILMDYYQISASAFADRIKVQRSSISHLLSGRNKPSLEFVMKVVKEFKEVELYWLLNGKGDFPKTGSYPKPEDEDSHDRVQIIKDENNMVHKASSGDELVEDSIERIVIFYKNGSFKEYKP